MKTRVVSKGTEALPLLTRRIGPPSGAWSTKVCLGDHAGDRIALGRAGQGRRPPPGRGRPVARPRRGPSGRTSRCRCGRRPVEAREEELAAVQARRWDRGWGWPAQVGVALGCQGRIRLGEAAVGRRGGKQGVFLVIGPGVDDVAADRSVGGRVAAGTTTKPVVKAPPATPSPEMPWPVRRREGDPGSEIGVGGWETRAGVEVGLPRNSPSSWLP